MSLLLAFQLLGIFAHTPPSGGAAPVITQGSMAHFNGSTSGTCSLPSNATPGNSLLIGITIEGGSPPSIVSVLHDTDTCTPTSNSPYSGTVPTNPTRAALYYCFGIGSASKDIVVTLSGAPITTSIFVQEYPALSAVDQAPAGNSGSSTNVAANAATTTTASQVLFGVLVGTGGPTVIAPFAIPSTCPSGTPCTKGQWFNHYLVTADVAATGNYSIQSSNALTWSTLWASFK